MLCDTKASRAVQLEARWLGLVVVHGFSGRRAFVKTASNRIQVMLARVRDSVLVMCDTDASTATLMVLVGQASVRAGCWKKACGLLKDSGQRAGGHCQVSSIKRQITCLTYYNIIYIYIKYII